MFGIGAELSYLFSIIYTFYNSELLGMPVRPLDKGGRFAASFQNQNVCVKQCTCPKHKLPIIHNFKIKSNEKSYFSAWYHAPYGRSGQSARR
jgi:hypothetical protein